MNSNLRKYTKNRLGKSILKYFLGKIPITAYLIIINIILFLIFSILEIFNKGFIVNFIALTPENIVHGAYLWTIITSMFMHANFAHLFFNMFSLFFIGTFVEKIVGRKRFIWFYLIAGIFASLFFAGRSGFFGSGELLGKIFGPSNISGVGASGAIFGLLGLLAVLTPLARVYLILGPLLAIVVEAVVDAVFPGAAFLGVFSILINLYFILSIFAIISFNSRLSKFALPVEIPFWLLPIVAIVPLVVIGFFVDLPIGNMAHLGGLIAGLIYGFYLRKKYSKKIKLLNQHFH